MRHFTTIFGDEDSSFIAYVRSTADLGLTEDDLETLTLRVFCDLRDSRLIAWDKSWGEYVGLSGFEEAIRQTLDGDLREDGVAES